MSIFLAIWELNFLKTVPYKKLYLLQTWYLSFLSTSFLWKNCMSMAAASSILALPSAQCAKLQCNFHSLLFHEESLVWRHSSFVNQENICFANEMKESHFCYITRQCDVLITGSNFNNNLFYLVLKTLRMFANQIIAKQGIHDEYISGGKFSEDSERRPGMHWYIWDK